MRNAFELIVHFFVTLVRLMKPGGVKLVMADTLAMKQQLIVINRGRKKSPPLTTSDRFMFGILALLIGENRTQKVAVIFKPCPMRIANFKQQSAICITHHSEISIGNYQWRQYSSHCLR